MSSGTWSGPEVTADQLRLLLTRPGRYRDRWARRVEKSRGDEISQAAVARVIADYLTLERRWDHTDQSEHRRLKDKVHRALSGKALTPETLGWFISAFLLTRDDARFLWTRYTGGEDNSGDIDAYLRRLATPPSDAAAFDMPRFITTSLHATLEIDARRKPRRQITRQRIRAHQEWIWRFPLRFRDPVEDIRPAAGCDKRTDLYRCDDGMWAVDLILATPLARGSEVEIGYDMVYPDHTEDDQRFQRGLARETQDVKIELRFDDAARPEQVWWATWREFAADNDPNLREPLYRKGHRPPRISKTLTSATDTTVGFCWKWPEK
jgi:hypothetical protein